MYICNLETFYMPWRIAGPTGGDAGGCWTTTSALSSAACARGSRAGGAKQGVNKELYSFQVWENGSYTPQVNNLDMEIEVAR